MKDIIHLVMWVFIGALVVLIVTHASGFSTAVSSVGGQITNDAALLAGYGPQGGGATGASLTSNAGGGGGQAVFV